MKEDLGDKTGSSRCAPEAASASSPSVSIPIAMDKRTLTALRGSIAKWEEIVTGTGADHGPDNCPLCELFNTYEGDVEELECLGCPVKDRTGKPFCKGTPYDRWTGASGINGLPIGPAGERFALEELEFLRSLLPAQGIVTEGQDPQGLGEREARVEPDPEGDAPDHDRPPTPENGEG